MQQVARRRYEAGGSKHVLVWAQRYTHKYLDCLAPSVLDRLPYLANPQNWNMGKLYDPTTKRVGKPRVAPYVREGEDLCENAGCGQGLGRRTRKAPGGVLGDAPRSVADLLYLYKTSHK